VRASAVAVRFDDSADSMKHHSLTEVRRKGEGRAHRIG
jgi:hypothetical protein